MLLGGTKLSGYQNRPYTSSTTEPKQRLVTTKNNISGFKTSPKAGHFVKVPKTRPTRKICQERLACKGPRRVAVFECVQCATLQCEACETLIHEKSRFVFHDRHQLPLPNKDHLCEYICEAKNLADVYCNQCKKRLCYDCELVLHHNRGKNHIRNPFETDEFFSLTNFLEKNYSEEEPATFFSFQDQDHQVAQTSEESLSPVFDGAFDSLNVQQFASLEQCDNQSTFYGTDSPDSFKSIPGSTMMTLESLPDVADIGGDNIYKVIQDARRQSKEESTHPRSFLLIDDKESLKVDNEEDFVRFLGCKNDHRVKVVSIFGNTGEGKSHTLNYTFFGGREIFKTSATQISCTIGVWAAFDPVLNTVVLDTEGLLGLTSNQNQRTRLLLKVLAVSDVIIYRTRAERLHNDLFSFLGDASKAYSHHFSHELKAASKRFNFEGPLSSLGPAVIIFQETTHTDVLKGDQVKSCEDLLKERFRELDQDIDAFNSLQYVGTRTDGQTSFTGLAAAVKKQLHNLSVRSARVISVVYKALKVLNLKFSGDIDKAVKNTFPDQYFTCNVNCSSCETRCTLSMNHIQDGISHNGASMCRYQHQYDNKIYLCQVCYQRGETVNVVPKTSSSSESAWFGIAKYAWAGYVLECSNCGVIYRSRQYWYGNKDPWETAVRTEICHVWPGVSPNTQSNQNAAQRVLDSVTYLSDAVSSISAKPTKTLTSWVADQIAPQYWTPNYKITNCHGCQKLFDATETKHHCRSCGEGFCDICSSNTKPVPERGWGPNPVRVCNKCFEETEEQRNERTLEDAVTVRKVGEVLHSAMGTVASAIDYPIGFIKDTARPAYWVPDDQIKECAECKTTFSNKLSLHHCRGCGSGVCDYCSLGRVAVPSRGWDYPVRVCDSCEKRTDL